MVMRGMAAGRVLRIGARPSAAILSAEPAHPSEASYRRRTAVLLMLATVSAAAVQADV